MKKYLALLLAGLATQANAGVTQEDAFLINRIQGPAFKTKLGTQVLKGVVQVANVVWDYDAHGGSTGTINLDVELPDYAQVQDVGYRVVEKPVVVGSVTFALGASIANNLVAEKNPSNIGVGNYAGAILETNGMAGYFDIGASTTTKGWPINLVIKDAATEFSSNNYMTSGKIVFFIKYVVGEGN